MAKRANSSGVRVVEATLRTRRAMGTMITVITAR